MFPRRLLQFLARFVLAWFALHVGAGVAAPALRQDAGLQLVCAGGMVKLLPGSGDEGDARLAGMDCPLCSPAIAPPPSLAVLALLSPAPATVLVVGAPAAARPAFTPAPARGPPAYTSA